MKIHLYAFVYNDIDILPFFLKYYTPIVDKMIFYDSASTDGTLDLIKQYNGEVRQTGHKIWDWDAGLPLMNNMWKSDKCDYIIFADVDEIYYHPNLRKLLELNKDRIDIYQMEGFQMVSREFPKLGSNILDINMGIPLPLHNKYRIFNPKCDIEYINAHDIKTSSEKINRFVIKLLHYKYLGIDIMVKRAAKIKARVPANSFCKGIGGNILKVYPAFVKTRQEYEVEINQMLKDARRVI